MIAAWAAVLATLAYICALFAVAHYGDTIGRRFVRGPAQTLVAAGRILLAAPGPDAENGARGRSRKPGQQSVRHEARRARRRIGLRTGSGCSGDRTWPGHLASDLWVLFAERLVSRRHATLRDPRRVGHSCSPFLTRL